MMCNKSIKYILFTSCASEHFLCTAIIIIMLIAAIFIEIYILDCTASEKRCSTTSQLSAPSIYAQLVYRHCCVRIQFNSWYNLTSLLASSPKQYSLEDTVR